MTDIITTLHPENDESTNLYPNIKKENIPNESIDRNKLDSGVNNLLNSINELHPSGVDTSTNILAFTTDKGIYVATDTGDWYFWNGTQYEVGREFMAVTSTYLVSASNYATRLPNCNNVSGNGLYILLFNNGDTSFPLNTPYGSTFKGDLAFLQSYEAYDFCYQIFTSDKGESYMRLQYNNAWGNWIKNILLPTQIVNASNYATRLPDCNNVTQDSSFILVFNNGDTSFPLNTPYKEMFYGDIALLRTEYTQSYIIQRFINPDRCLTYIRFKFGNAWSEWKAESDRKYIITSSSNFISKWKSIPKGETIYVREGTYDLIQIYKDYYGNDFWDNYTGYLGQSDEFLQGIPIKNNTKVIFSPNAKFTCNYTGNNDNVLQYFSAFAMGNGYEIVGLNLVVSGIRYALHDDFNTTQTPFTCKIFNSKITDNTHRAIGGGMGVNSNYIFKGNIFKGVNISFGYHNHSSSSACSSFDVSENYCIGKISFRYYGSSTDMTEVLLSNNSMSENYELIPETEDSTNININIRAWNNVIRE